ncbi:MULTISPECIES: hypothetical protein [Bacillaceae]|uniref:Lipoprotein n=1 Tax=Alkalicoccobacillus plakortidis TaxID=444060 RepID=A0A9D5HZV4_9BACI|nr:MULTISPECIES: hypothetical protein [Bacillaceae]KQL55781.1 hypothetical protein AN965_17040 [Alkalicoccobacillus plakortidis]
MRYSIFTFTILLTLSSCTFGKEQSVFNLEFIVSKNKATQNEYMLEIEHLDEPRYMDHHPVAYVNDPFEKDANLYLTENRSVNVPVEIDMRYSITVFETTLTEIGEEMNLHQNKGNPLWVGEVLINDDTKQLIDLN